VGQSIRQQGHDGQAGAGDRFIVVGQRASHGTEGGTLPLPGQLIPAALLLIPAALLLIPAALLLIPAAMDPGPLRERADQLLVDRRRGRGDCDSVHQASETSAARTVTGFPAFVAIPSLPVQLSVGRVRAAEAGT